MFARQTSALRRACAATLLALLFGIGLAAPSTAAEPTVPDPISGLVLESGNGAVTLNWSPPADDGGSPVFGYVVSWSPGGGDARGCPGTTTQCSVTGLTPGTAYTFSVRASNEVGFSTPVTGTVTPGSAPSTPEATFGTMVVGEPYNVQVTAPGPWTPERWYVWQGALPDGLTLDLFTGTVSGTPTAAGPWSAQILASNYFGSAATTFSGTVEQAPSITTSTIGPVPYGIYLNFQLGVEAAPEPVWFGTDVPPWLTLDGDGVLSGTPVAAGTYEFEVTALNEHGSDSRVISVVVSPSLPAAPSIVDVTPGDGRLAIDFTAPSTDGGVELTGYEYSLDGGDTWAPATLVDGAAVLTDLSNGTTYEVALRAVNETGPSVPSAVVTATPFTVPDAPVMVSATPGDGVITLSFDAGSFDGGSPVTGYQYTLDDGATWVGTAAAPGEAIDVDGLDNGTEYSVAIRALNAAGPSAASQIEAVTPRTTSDAPTVTSVIEGDGELTVRFSAPDFDGGDVITGYEYSLGDEYPWESTAVLPGEDLVIDGLTNGSGYLVTVRAINAAGPGSPSTSVRGTPRTVPGSPGISSVTSRDGRLIVVVDEPASNGGSRVLRYEYSLDDGATWNHADLQDVDFQILGLDNGMQYSLQVRAVNEAGPSAPSGAVFATPYTTPSAPTVTLAEPGDGSVTVQFDAATDDGGSAITEYTYSLNGLDMVGTVPVGPGEPFIIDGLTNGTEYVLELYAVNAGGSGVPSEAITFTPMPTLPETTAPPAQPGAPVATAPVPPVDVPAAAGENLAATGADIGLVGTAAALLATGLALAFAGRRRSIAAEWYR